MPSPLKSTIVGLTSWPSMFSFASRPMSLKIPLAVARRCLAQEIGVGGIDEDVELAVAVPIHDAQLAAAALAGDAGVQPNGAGACVSSQLWRLSVTEKFSPWKARRGASSTSLPSRCARSKKAR